MDNNAYSDITDVLRSSNLKVSYTFDNVSDSANYSIHVSNREFVSIDVHNSYAPEITVRLFGRNEVNIYQSTGSMIQALDYIRRLINDVKKASATNLGSYVEFSIRNKVVRFYVMETKFDGPLKILNKKPFPRLFYREKLVNF